jgi:hypothetical protein
LYGKALLQDIYPEYYLIKAADFDENITDTLDEWVYFFKKGEIKDNFKAKGILKAKNKLDVAKLTPTQRQLYSRYLEQQRDLASHNETVLKDREDARKEGVEEGERKAKYEMAENLLRSGATVAFGVQITGLLEE